MRIFHLALALSLAINAWGQTHYVLGHPYLNLRNESDRDEVVAKLPYGTEVRQTGRTFEDAQIAGLEGNWVEVVWNESEDSEVKGVVFDAFIFPVEVPEFFQAPESGSLDILEYARSHADDGSSLGYNSCEGFDAYEHGEFGNTSLYFVSTTGQALRFFRMWVQDSFAPHIASGWMSETSQKELETGLTMTWDGSGQLFIGPCMEAFILQWTLEKLKPMEEGLYYFSINYEEIAD